MWKSPFTNFSASIKHSHARRTTWREKGRRLHCISNVRASNAMYNQRKMQGVGPRRIALGKTEFQWLFCSTNSMVFGALFCVCGLGLPKARDGHWVRCELEVSPRGRCSHLVGLRTYSQSSENFTLAVKGL